MPSIALKDGDFGADTEIVVNETELFLPDPARPGLRTVVPFTDVEAIDAVDDDRSGQYREAVRLGLKGFSAAGPVGLAASILAVRKPKSVVFKVRLRDGRGFSATADAATYATLRGYHFAARRPPSEKGNSPAERAADAIVARYLAAKPPGGGRTGPPPSAGVSASPPDEAGAPVFGRRRS